MSFWRNSLFPSQRKKHYLLIVGVYSAFLGLFLPSGGGKWVVEAPYLLQAATELKVNLAWVVQCYNALKRCRTSSIRSLCCL